MSTLFLNPNLTQEQAMDLYEKKARSMCDLGGKCFSDIKPTLEKWASEDAERDAKFPPTDEYERWEREQARWKRNSDYHSTMIGMGMQFIVMGIFS